VAEQAIVEYTAVVAQQIAKTYANAPFDELRAWVRIAYQREAMVTQLYKLSQIDARLGHLDQSGAASVVRAALSSIWAHEESHTRFLGGLLGLSDTLSGITGLQGRLEGIITGNAVSGSLLARALIAIGVSLGEAPPFASELRQMNLLELIHFHGELETTACMGYQRILDLTRLLDPKKTEALQGTFGLTFDLDLAKIRCEEAFHEDAFREMARWVASDRTSFDPLPRPECVQILHDLCERSLSVGAVRQTAIPSAAVSKGQDVGDGAWVSDGGLGKLFTDYALKVPVLPADIAISRLRARG
jgi:hypothetical protein